MAEERGGTIYAAYIRAQLGAQDARKESIEGRGISVITTSGTLVSLLFALIALLTGAKDYELPSGAEPWLYAALLAFVLAAIGGIVTNAPVFYSGVKIAGLRLAISKFWSEDPDQAEKRIAITDIKILATAKARNTFKGFVLLAAITCELLAIVFLAQAIRVILEHA